MVTSRDERSWDMSVPMLFLDAGCLSYSQKKKLDEKGIKYIIYKSSFEIFEKYKEGQSYVIGLCDQIIDTVSSVLNEHHNVNYDVRSWNILLRRWLLCYLGYYYYRYKQISDIINQYEVFCIDLSSGKQWDFPFGTDFIRLVNDSDLYNSFSGARIARILGIEVIEKTCYLEQKVQCEKKDSGTDKGILGIIYGLMVSVLEHLSQKGEVILYGNPIEFSWKYLIKSILLGGCCLKNTERNENRPNLFAYKKTMKLRSSFFADANCEGHTFEEILYKWLSEDFPIAYVEGFNDVKEQSILYFGKTPKLFYSHNGWIDDEMAKAFTAYGRANGMMLCGIQHGGGDVFCCFFNNRDLCMVDRYYAWGLTGYNKDRFIKSMPSPKLSKGILYNGNTQKSEKKKVLFVGNGASCYLRRIHEYPLMMNTYTYVEFQLRLIKKLHEKISNVKLRLYGNEQDWNLKERLSSSIDVFDEFDEEISYEKSLNSAKLCIFDNVVTTWTEAYIRRIPFFFVISPEMEDYTEEAKRHISLLKDVDVYFNDIDKAIETINKIEYNVYDWWFEPQRKKIVDTFAENYTKHSINWQKEWLKEIKNERRLLKKNAK